MKTSNTNKKNNLERLTKVLGIGALSSLGFKANGKWIAEYTAADNVIKMENQWFPTHQCFTTTSTSYLFPS